MTVLRIVLTVLGLLPFCLGLVVLLDLTASRARIRRLTSLEENGTEAAARVVELRYISWDERRMNATVTVDFPDGETLRRTLWVPLRPDLAVGGPCPVVRHPRAAEGFEPGTKADLARLRHHERTVEIPETRKLGLFFVLIGAAPIALAAALPALVRLL
ncbi:hypothetical protein [Kitasatospora sp. DSM 101779]|uniref:hypothetical protein n=1 Tax=Kitasatospora sp. DSM 101779 TaxID=2853165 RepID=UPI0021D9FA5D|nr:hypothetical protein [Kitasatospora sp. DSM 101779]MCU7821299.1 hypothetical protein [Kitasatospora sp. DSM 101779]